MYEENGNLPLGFAMALAQNPHAMNNFSVLSTQQKEYYISRARHVKSKSEMQQLVSSIGNIQNYFM